MEQTGYSLIDGSGTELQAWGNVRGVCQGIPNMMILPNGDHVHAPVVGETYGGCKLVERWMDEDAAPSTSFDGTKFVEKLQAPSLDTVQSELKRRVDADAETVRLRYITPGAGMAMTYQEKKDQAVAVIAMGEAAANALASHGAQEFPTLSASVPVEAASLYAAAQVVIARYEAWAAVSRGIELSRLAGKKAISDASDAAAARAAYEAITWPTP